MHAVLNGLPVQAFATILTTDKDLAIISRTGHGINKPAHLAGKRALA